jgi:hypothetical protein
MIGAGTSGAGTSGAGTSGAGTSGAGTSGAGTSGAGTSGAGTSGAGTSGAAKRGLGLRVLNYPALALDLFPTPISPYLWTPLPDHTVAVPYFGMGRSILESFAPPAVQKSP